MVRPDGTLTLVDYDGMFVPAMKGQKSPTIGTKDFSHPLRTIDDFDETIDDFALASIALSLKAISLDPSLLQNYGASDRLLFSAADYLDLSKSNTFTALQGLLADEEARTLMSMFLLASAKKNLSMCSFRLFGVQKPKEEEVWSTEVTKEDLKNAPEYDEDGNVKEKKEVITAAKLPYRMGLNEKQFGFNAKNTVGYIQTVRTSATNTNTVMKKFKVIWKETIIEERFEVIQGNTKKEIHEALIAGKLIGTVLNQQFGGVRLNSIIIEDVT
jgi:hypothetical protein